ncbi:MAG TPA: energy-coupling factor transporter transmembrane component T [Anaerolineales bacterium]|nr:energy-coupling factor transporter transmembrane component T [Anaerolineales bacterium]
MASPIEFFSNVEKDSWVHRMDPRVKILMVLCLASLPLLFSDPLYLLGWFVLFLVLIMSAKIDIKPIMILFYGGLVMVFVYIMYGTFLAYPEETLVYAKFIWRWGPLVATDIGFYNGLILGSRLLILLMPIVLIIATSEPSMLAKGFMKLGMPITISFILLATLRFLPLVFEVATRVMEAQRVRGLNHKTFKERISNFKFLLLPLFINTLRQSRTLGLAVESKGFGARQWKEFYRDFAMTKTDWIILVILLIFVAAMLYIRFGLNLGWSAIYRP